MNRKIRLALAACIMAAWIGLSVTAWIVISSKPAACSFCQIGAPCAQYVGCIGAPSCVCLVQSATGYGRCVVVR